MLALFIQEMKPKVLYRAEAYLGTPKINWGWDGNWGASWADTLLRQNNKVKSCVGREKSQSKDSLKTSEISHRSTQKRSDWRREFKATSWKSRVEILILMLIDCFDALLSV